MATDSELLREHLINQVVINLPKKFLEEYNRRGQMAYDATFAEVYSDPTTLNEQKLAKLIQTRCFRMDWELFSTAEKYDMPVTAKQLPENTWTYTYASSGSFGITQSYVQKLGSLPQPAKFRENLASAANMPRLPLDEPKDIYTTKDFYALLAHNPVKQKFDEPSQKMGGLQVCIPHSDMKTWALEISVPELLSRYPVEMRRRDRTKDVAWRPNAKPNEKSSTDKKLGKEE